MDQSHLHSKRFNEEGFNNLIVKCTENELQCRTNVYNEDHFKEWKEIYCLASRTSLSVLRTREGGARTVFCQHLICQFGSKRNKGIKRHSTGCSFQMAVQIKTDTTRKRRRDKLVVTHPCLVTITGLHNHIDDAETLKELRVLPGVKEVFEEYFKRGMAVPEAHRYHKLKMDLSDDYCVDRVRGDTNPSLRSVGYMFQKWLKNDMSGYSEDNTCEALDLFTVKSKSVIEVERGDTGSICVALVTPFMRRVHRLREASDVVFVDAIASADQLNTAVVSFHCASAAGVLPLGVIFATSQDEAQLTTGFRLLQKALGDTAFDGRSHPVTFITDNCDATKNALRTVWPMSAQFLCVSHVLRQAWNWLLDSSHGVCEEKRQELMDTLRKLVYAESPEHFQAQLDGLNVSHVGFARYLTDLAESREEWAISFRQGTHRGSHHSNNHAAATMCIMKDIVQNRWKVRNAYELVMLVDEIYNGYMVRRLIDFALDQHQSKRLASSTVPEKAITRVDEQHFRVISDKDPQVICDVALDVGTCSCQKGQSSEVCKHQVACAHSVMAKLPSAFLPTPENRRWLMSVAVTEDKVPELNFFTDFRARESTGARGDPPTNSDTDTNAGVIDPVDLDSVLSVLDDVDYLESHSPVSQPSAIEEVMSQVSQPHPVQEAVRPASDPNPADEVVGPALQPNPAEKVAGPTSQLISAEQLQRPSAHVIAKFHEALDRALELFGDGLTNEALQKATSRVASLTNSAQLNSWLDSLGSSTESACRAAAGCVETNVQPPLLLLQPPMFLLQPTSVCQPPVGLLRCQGMARRLADAPGQAAKRPRCLGENVVTNEATGMSHSSGH